MLPPAPVRYYRKLGHQYHRQKIGCGIDFQPGLPVFGKIIRQNRGILKSSIWYCF
jgi:hypothetical protein